MASPQPTTVQPPLPCLAPQRLPPAHQTCSLTPKAPFARCSPKQTSHDPPPLTQNTDSDLSSGRGPCEESQKTHKCIDRPVRRGVHPISGFTDQPGTHPVYGASQPLPFPWQGRKISTQGSSRRNRQAWALSGRATFWASRGRSVWIEPGEGTWELTATAEPPKGT